MAQKFTPQVDMEHYFKDYDDLSRFISYYYQTSLVKELQPENILEIGVGNKTVSGYLKQYGFRIDTCDFDRNLGPDFVADIRSLPFRDGSYDVVMACEILEHIPWQDVEQALDELGRVAKKFVLVSLPYSSAYMELLINSNLLRRFFKTSYPRILLRIPFFFRSMHFSGEHYWEIGRRNFPQKKIRNLLREGFIIRKELSPAMDPYHLFFVLEKG